MKIIDIATKSPKAPDACEIAKAPDACKISNGT